MIVIIRHNVVPVNAANSITMIPTMTTTWLFPPSSSPISATVKSAFTSLLQLWKVQQPMCPPQLFDGLHHLDNGSNKLNDTGISTLAPRCSCSKRWWWTARMAIISGGTLPCNQPQWRNDHEIVRDQNIDPHFFVQPLSAFALLYNTHTTAHWDTERPTECRVWHPCDVTPQNSMILLIGTAEVDKGSNENCQDKH
jgi:hypothetical protein